jgi:hypothetical protein
MKSMPLPRRTFRLVIQRVGENRRPSFRVIAYGEASGINARAEFATLQALLGALETAVPDVVLNLRAEGSIIFAGEMGLDDAQLRAMGLT